MPRKPTASFIVELPLKADPGDQRACAIILDAGRNITNAVLGEALRRLDLMRESRACRAARKMSRGQPRSPEPLPQRYHQFPDGTRIGRDLYCAFLARFVLDNRLDAIQAAKAWRGAQAFLRVASNGLEPASGKGFALPLATLGVRAGRSKKYHANHREAGDGVALAVLPVARALESGEAPRGSLWPSG